ncbi:hypothetical protein ACH5RR_006542 [Cinchona calisaya]|uniref:Uncharacterized protein n=1 Tax=Cinchona calisaya TaxID=153742 RepID=A0ABD3APC5_9GENT
MLKAHDKVKEHVGIVIGYGNACTWYDWMVIDPLYKFVFIVSNEGLRVKDVWGINGWERTILMSSSSIQDYDVVHHTRSCVRLQIKDVNDKLVWMQPNNGDFSVLLVKEFAYNSQSMFSWSLNR